MTSNARYARIRCQSTDLAGPLSEADCQAQSMPDASPAKWHLAHTTWFFETFVLERFESGFRPFDPSYRVLFNSYYQGVGEQHPRPQRGLITRPGLSEILAYRVQVDERMNALMHKGLNDAMAELVELGLQHEQQHQELLLTDIKHLLSCNPTDPIYRTGQGRPTASAQPPLSWSMFEGGVVRTGHSGMAFAFDNEQPCHDALVRPFALANRMVTQGEWLAFMHDGGYQTPRWWMAAGWDWVRQQGIDAPLYWRREGVHAHYLPWSCFTLHGRETVDLHAPVAHISWYEADAYARWLGTMEGHRVRLPTETEWEHAAIAMGRDWSADGNFLETGTLCTRSPAASSTGLQQLGGDAWEWTASPYTPYPGYRPWTGAVGEYNGKFMVNQMVLRGGSCVTPQSHIRPSYRNFFPTDARWQFSGVRLARDA
ncbi:MAG: ergothioneine biosynthesis protein EgtB [Burkholderiaceae bacterium]